MSVRAVNGKFNPFENPDVVQHLSLDKMHSVQYLDKACSKWVTIFRTSPSIGVNNESVVHMKAKENDISVREVLEGITSKKVGRDTPAIKVENSPIKRRNNTPPQIIDLTLLSEEPAEKRTRLGEDGSASPSRRSSPSPNRRYDGPGTEERMVGYAPAKLNKFPAKTVAEMDRRLQWIANTNGGLESKFGTVFSCKYVGSSYHNHRNAWIHLKEAGELTDANGDADWLPLYSRAIKEINAQSNKIPSNRPNKTRRENQTALSET